MLDNRYNLHKTQKRLVKQWLIVLAIIVAIVYISQPVQKPLSPCPETGCRVEYISRVDAAEPIVETPRYSKKTQQCIDKHPYVAERIKSILNDDKYAYDLICRESSFNPTIINKSSGACGLAQALPCSKMKCDLADVDCQLKWIGTYVEDRYGSFQEAINFHDQMNWY